MVAALAPKTRSRPENRKSTFPGRARDLGAVIAAVLGGTGTDTVKRILGREPTALAQFIRDYSAAFQPTA